MSATRARIASTDRNDRRTRTYVALAAPAMTNGAATTSQTTTVMTVDSTPRLSAATYTV